MFDRGCSLGGSGEPIGEPAESVAERGDDPGFLGFAIRLEGDGEADVGSSFVPGNGGDEVFADEPLGEVFAGSKVDDAAGAFGGGGGGDVEEEGAFGFGSGETEGGKQVGEEAHAPRVFGGDLGGDFGVVEGVSGGVLNAEKLAGIGVVFNIGVGSDEERVPGDEAATPAGHVKGFAGGMEFDPDVDGAGNAEEAEGFAFEDKSGVGSVVDNDEVVGFGEGDDFGEEGGCGGGTGGVVGIVEDEGFGFGENVSRDGSEVGEVAVLAGEGEIMDKAAVVFGVGAEDGIARGGHEGNVAGVDESGGEDAEGGFAADGVAEVKVGIEVDASDPFHVTGRGLAEAGSAVVGIAAVFGEGGLSGKRGNDFGEGHFVGLTDAEVEEFNAGMSFLGGAFGAFDFLELVDGSVEAVAGTADAVGE